MPATDTGTATEATPASTSSGSGLRCSSGRSRQTPGPADLEVGAAAGAAQRGVAGGAAEEPAQGRPGQRRVALPAAVPEGVQVRAEPAAHDRRPVPALSWATSPSARSASSGTACQDGPPVGSVSPSRDRSESTEMTGPAATGVSRSASPPRCR